MKNKLQNSGYKVYGGDTPYIWIKVPDQMTSWDFLISSKVSVGEHLSGFGLAGEGYFRLCINSRSNVLDAMERIINI